MDNLLKQIAEGFSQEKSLAHIEVKNRIDELNQYLKLLEKVSVEIGQVAVQHRKDIENLINDKVFNAKEISRLQAEYSELSKTYQKSISEKENHLKNLDADIKLHESKCSSLESHIKGLIVELKNYEERSTEARGVISTLERAVKSLTADEVSLKKSIEDKQKEESKLITSIEANKKEAARLSSDVAILEARSKK